MTDLLTAAKAALEALVKVKDCEWEEDSINGRKLLTNLRTAIAEAEKVERKSEFERGYDTGFLVGAEKGRTLSIPPGYKLIAREPTEEMSDEGAELYKNDGDWNDIFRAMWDAAPEIKT